MSTGQWIKVLTQQPRPVSINPHRQTTYTIDVLDLTSDRVERETKSATDSFDVKGRKTSEEKWKGRKEHSLQVASNQEHILLSASKDATESAELASIDTRMRASARQFNLPNDLQKCRNSQHCKYNTFACCRLADIPTQPLYTMMECLYLEGK